MKQLLMCLVAVAAIAVVFPGCAKKAKVTIPAAGKGLFGEEGVGPGGIPLTENPEGPFSEPENYPDPEARLVFVDVHFDYNKSDIRTSERPILEKVAGYMNGHGQLVIKVEGHCDERGSNEYNLALGEKRAKSAFEYLASMGIAPDRMKVISYGKSQPLDPGHDEAAWQKNRRDQFLVIEK